MVEVMLGGGGWMNIMTGYRLMTWKAFTLARPTPDIRTQIRRCKGLQVKTLQHTCFSLLTSVHFAPTGQLMCRKSRQVDPWKGQIFAEIADLEKQQLGCGTDVCLLLENRQHFQHFKSKMSIISNVYMYVYKIRNHSSIYWKVVFGFLFWVARTPFLTRYLRWQ